jgi:hypothetical protein
MSNGRLAEEGRDVLCLLAASGKTKARACAGRRAGGVEFRDKLCLRRPCFATSASLLGQARGRRYMTLGYDDTDSL